MARKTENNETGWICLHRAMRGWQWYDNPIIKAVFIDLLFSACTEPTWFKGRKLGRGQSVISVDTLAKNNGISKPTTIKALKQLEDSGEIVRNKWKFYVITTICNYSKYQDFNSLLGKNNLPTSLPTSLPTLLPNKQYNNNNNIIGGKYIAHARTHEEIIQDLISSQSLVEQYCKNERITPDQFKRLAEAVGVEWSLTGEHYTTESDTKKRLLAHIRSKALALNLQSKPLKQRKADFLAECKALVDKGCNRDKVAEFARYYTQLEQGGERMLWETYKGWDTETRFLLNQKLISNGKK